MWEISGKSLNWNSLIFLNERIKDTIRNKMKNSKTDQEMKNTPPENMKSYSKKE